MTLQDINKAFDDKFSLIQGGERSECDLCGHDHTHMMPTTIEEWKKYYGSELKSFIKEQFTLLATECVGELTDFDSMKHDLKGQCDFQANETRAEITKAFRDRGIEINSLT